MQALWSYVSDKMGIEMKIYTVVGARPNFVKIAMLSKMLDDDPDIDHRIIHTGQHYDKGMSDIFFDELNISNPHTNLGVGSDTHAVQTARIMERFEHLLLHENQPDLVIVVGDINSTLATSIVVSKFPHIKLVHIESGYRRPEIDTPEEVNRRVTDVLSDILFCTNIDCRKNLILENISSSKIHYVGNPLADVIYEYTQEEEREDFILVTLHRPRNVDNEKRLKEILYALNVLGSRYRIKFAAHPRTMSNIKYFNAGHLLNRIEVSTPKRYLNFIKELRKAKCVITDSGGVQVESSIVKTPCITYTNYTVHQSTIEMGMNVQIDYPESLIELARDIMKGKYNYNFICHNPDYDGNASERMYNIIKEL